MTDLRDACLDLAEARCFHRGRICLGADDREKASQLHIGRGGIGIGAQCWGLKKKLLEIDELITPPKQRIVHEVHPEVSFCAMNGGRPLKYRKKSSDYLVSGQLHHPHGDHCDDHGAIELA